jgi:transcriptional regulator with XRE-family HTH domain
VSTKQPHLTDKHVGNRLRLRRLMLGMSQEKLADQLGITFQQVQKYEKGTNRITAGRLHQVSQVLGVPVSYFFEQVPVPIAHGEASSATSSHANVDQFLASSSGLALVTAFMRINNPALQRLIVRLIEGIAEAGGS